MRFRLLAVFPVVAAALLVVSCLAVDPAARRPVQHAGAEIAKLLALIGCAVAAAAFDRGDYLRRAWALCGACFVLLLTRDALQIGLGIGNPPPPYWPYLAGALVIAANASTIVGLWLLARTWSVAGLELPGSLLTRRAATGAAILLALIIVGAPIAADASALAGGDVRSLVALASGIGDAISLSLVAPLLLTAVATRGGLLGWPWTLLATSLVAWLLYDAAVGLPSLTTVPAEPVRIAGEAFRVLACALTFSAGVAQRWAIVAK